MHLAMPVPPADQCLPMLGSGSVPSGVTRRGFLDVGRWAHRVFPRRGVGESQKLVTV
jgi:hypothetical protein